MNEEQSQTLAPLRDALLSKPMSGEIWVFQNKIFGGNTA
jgi:hypothetical protein